MLVLELQSLTLALPHNLVPAGAAALAMLLAAATLRSRHPRGARWIALGLRLLVLAALGLALASPSVMAEIEEKRQPQGVWRHEAGRESAEALASRARDGLAAGKPPSVIEIRGTAEACRAAAAVLEPLGLPLRINASHETTLEVPALTAIECPPVLAPGEPLPAVLRVAGVGGSVRLLADGVELWRGTPEGAAAWPPVALEPGRHVLEAELAGPSGDVVQRLGHVLRVEDMPRLLALGMDTGAFARLELLAPNYRRTRVAMKDLDRADLQRAEVVVLPADACLEMTDRQALMLTQFVANGGGVLVTGDGADRVVPQYLPPELRRLLPVRLLEQQRDKPPDPPVKEEIGKAEVAAVSIAYVIDRSTSMEARVGKATRWDVAVEAVRTSLEKLDPWDRAGVLAFTLKRTWMPRPKVVAPFDREMIARDLRDMQPDHEYDKRGYNTDIYKAVEEALDVMEKEPSAVKMLVVLTDGGDRDDDGGKVRNHRELAERAISKKINIVSLGIGDAFYGAHFDAQSARRVVENLATKREFAYIAPDARTAEIAPTVFARAVTLAYEAYNEEMARREIEKLRRAAAQPDKPPEVDVAKGEHELAFTAVGVQLLGASPPRPSPRLARYARSELRDGAAAAITAPGGVLETPPVLALSGYALGRTAFWASGLDESSLGDAGRWKDFPRFFAQLVRWLQPRNEPDPRLISGATPAGIGLMDPVEGAQYFLRRADGQTALTLTDGELRAPQGELPSGAAEVVERLGSEERRIGDVFIATRPLAPGKSRVLDPWPPAHPALEAVITTRTLQRQALEPLLALLVAALCLLPLERFIRRRN